MKDIFSIGWSFSCDAYCSKCNHSETFSNFEEDYESGNYSKLETNVNVPVENFLCHLEENGWTYDDKEDEILLCPDCSPQEDAD